MRVIMALVVLLAVISIEARRLGRRDGQNQDREQTRGRGKGKGRGRAGTAKRFVADCMEYYEDGEKFLDCQDQRLVAVPRGLPEDTVHLLLARNRIRVLQEDAFVGLSYLRSLDLQQNELVQIEKRAFAGLRRLTTLLLQHNNLQVMTEEALLPLPRLTYLRLYDNPWDCRCPLDTLVRTLQVPSNRNLGNYARCSEPPGLKGHKLKKVRPELVCPELEKNLLQETGQDEGEPTPVKTKPDATDTCHTYMFPMPFLDCQNRDLKNIPANIAPDVVKVDLSRNNIKVLKGKEFSAARDLRFLNLSSNGLIAIDMAAFKGLLFLRGLDLSNNSLHNIQYGVLEDLYFIRQLALGANPWVCDYNIHYLLYWLKLHPGVHHSGLICHSPPEFAGWSVQEYVRTYNGKCPDDQLPVAMSSVLQAKPAEQNLYYVEIHRNPFGVVQKLNWPKATHKTHPAAAWLDRMQ